MRKLQALSQTFGQFSDLLLSELRRPHWRDPVRSALTNVKYEVLYSTALVSIGNRRDSVTAAYY